MGIPAVISQSSAWIKKSDDSEGAQIDLLITRNDNVVNMCEIKYYGGEFTINKEYYAKLLGRQTLLAQNLSKRMTIHNTMITTFGVTPNEYSNIFVNVITLDDLFKE